MLAGHTRTKDIKRMANLLQVSSAYGRAMESMDRAAMSAILYPTLRKMKLSPGEISNVIAACAEGYAFPTNLDRDPPIGGLARKPSNSSWPRPWPRIGRRTYSPQRSRNIPGEG